MEENNKPIRIGKITFGVILILIGISVFIQTLTNLDILRYILMLTPLVLVLLGIELLIYRNKENIKYDIVGTIFIFFIIGIVGIFSIINYGVNKFIYNDEFRQAISEHNSNCYYESSFGTNIKFKNFKNNEKVELKTNIVEGKTDTIVKIKVKEKNEDSKNEWIFNNNSIFDYIFIDYENHEITLLDSFEQYHNIEVTIITGNSENIIFE